MKVLYAVPFGVFALVACSASAPDPVTSTASELASPDTCCVCGTDLVCDAAKVCIPRPNPQSGELFARVELLQQFVPTETNLLSKLGTASASFNAADPLPKDTRTKFTTDEGEDCFFEEGSMYPSYYNGRAWPSTPGLAAGTLTFDVAGARGRIELDPLETNGDTGYFHNKDVPPALADGSSSFPDFFDPSYLPSGRDVTMHIAGGANIAVDRIAGVLPAAFTVTEPAIESSATVTAVSGADLPVSWSHPQASAYMEIFVTMFNGSDVNLLSCKVKDDGHAVIPGPALNIFYGDVGIQLRRTTERYTRVRQPSGEIVHVFVAGRHARIGNLSMKLP
jgi:hypothetical protein